MKVTFVFFVMAAASAAALPLATVYSEQSDSLAVRDGTTAFDPDLEFKAKRDGTTAFDPDLEFK
ncbi:hypothetical protein Daus18300_013750 [Diaporthe australafricana]|uniref:Uncharacterized protein n=1 Tax=Diaporthe australafricana TaxID=127596 RepID=A0ABR3VY19_9PEZI